MLNELTAQIKKICDDRINEIHTVIPAKIVSFDADKCEAEAQPLARYRTPDGRFIDYPKISKVPVMFMQSRQSSIIFPVRPGDECLLFFAEKTLEDWRGAAEQTRYSAQSDINLKYDLTNAVAMMGRPAGVSKPELVKLAAERSAVVVEGDMVIAGHKNAVFDLKDGRVSIETSDLFLRGRVSILGNLSVMETPVLGSGDGSVKINTTNIAAMEKSGRRLGSLADMIHSVNGKVRKEQRKKDPITGKAHGYVFYAEVRYYDGEEKILETLEFIYNGFYKLSMGVFGPAIKGYREQLDESLYEAFVSRNDDQGWIDAQGEPTDFYVDVDYFCNLMDKIGLEITVEIKQQFSQKGRMSLAYCEIINEYAKQKGYLVIENNNLMAIKPHNVGDGSVTVGFGHYIQNSERKEYKEKYGIEINMSNEELSNIKIPIEDCVRIYKEDFKYHAGRVNINLEDENTVLTQNEFDALVIMRYNLGSLNDIHEIAIREPRAPREEFRTALLKKRNIDDFPGLKGRTDWELNIFYDNDYDIPPYMGTALTELRIEGLNT